MLRVARLLTRSSDAHYVEGRAEALPAADDSASVAWPIASVHHWGDVDAGLRELRRVLTPGGRFIAIERQTSPGATATRATAGRTRRRKVSPSSARCTASSACGWSTARAAADALSA
jgi:ubiquinone/menaquinone biosynthesis C-methylase UbiE